MKYYKHASILIASGAEDTQDAATITLSLCSTAAGANPVAGAGNDVLGGTIQNATSVGITLAAGNWPPVGLIVIEIDVNELEAAGVGGVLAGTLGVDSYVGLTIGPPAAVDPACVVVLSGGRFQEVSSPSVTV
jgi:hypothetical protein